MPESSLEVVPESGAEAVLELGEATMADHDRYTESEPEPTKDCTEHQAR